MRRQTKVRDAQYQRPLYRELIGRIAANVRLIRETRGWTQEEAAHQCDGMATFVFQCVETGEKNLTTTTLARLAEGLGVDPQDLLAPAKGPTKRRPGRPKSPKT